MTKYTGFLETGTGKSQGSGGGVFETSVVTGAGALVAGDSTVAGAGGVMNITTPDNRRGSVAVSIRNVQIAASPSRRAQPEE